MWLLVWPCLLLQNVRVYGWGRVGHKMVADIAWQLISEPAQDWIKLVLQEDNNLFSTTNYTSPLSPVSIWADAIRQRHEYEWTSKLHYVSVHNQKHPDQPCPVLSSECSFDYTIDCIQDVCAVGAIANYTSLMSDRKDDISTARTSLMRRAAAAAATTTPFTFLNSEPAQWIKNETKLGLYFVTHFVGDIHQPLHVSRGEDLGGNLIQVYFPTRSQDKGFLKLVHTNLHSVWDDFMIDRKLMEQYNNSQDVYTEALLTRLDNLTPQEKAKWLTPPKNCLGHDSWKCIASAWAQESLELAMNVAYVDEHAQEFSVSNTSIISLEYYSTRIEVAERRLIQAGLRLAHLLESVVEKVT